MVKTKNDAANSHLGPYEKWMLGPGKFFDLPGLKLDGPGFLSGLVEGQGFANSTNGSRDPKCDVHFPMLWDKVSASELNIAPALLFGDGKFEDLLTSTENQKDKSLDAVLNELNTQFSAGYPLMAENVDTNFDTDTMQSPPPLTPDPDRDSDDPLVIMAIIDDGVPFAHQNFRSRTTGKTRIDYCWVQSADTDHSHRVLFGKEFTSGEIDQQLKQNEFDEDAVYAATGAMETGGPIFSSLRNHYSHGAHTLDTMAGNNSLDENDEAKLLEQNSRIVAVSLPTTASWDTSGYGMDMFILSAIHYIFDRADKIAKAYGATNVPLVINLSYGYSGGPHDGSGQIEAAMDELLSLRQNHATNGAPTALVMPAGNLFMDGLHAVVTKKHVEEKNWVTLPWQIETNDRTSSFLEIWFPEELNLEDIKLRITAPDGCSLFDERTLSKTYFSQQLKVSDDDADSVVCFGEVTLAQYRNKKWRIVLAIAPTEYDGKAISLPGTNKQWGAAPSGLWKVELGRSDNGAALAGMGNDDAVSSGIECWIQRDEVFGPTETGARQSFFDDPLHVRFNEDGSPSTTDAKGVANGALVRHFGSMSGMCTGENVLRVGGYVKTEKTAADYSSAGPVRYIENNSDGVKIGQHVHCSAPSDRSILKPGIIAAGTRSGSVEIAQGTSSAAPFAARCLAYAFLKKGDEALNADEMRDNYVGLLEKHCHTKKPKDHGTTSSARFGDFLLTGF